MVSISDMYPNIYHIYNLFITYWGSDFPLLLIGSQKVILSIFSSYIPISSIWKHWHKNTSFERKI